MMRQTCGSGYYTQNMCLHAPPSDQRDMQVWSLNCLYFGFDCDCGCLSVTATMHAGIPATMHRICINIYNGGVDLSLAIKAVVSV